MGASFHAYPSVAQYVDAPPSIYSRAVPLACDVLEWDTTGCFDVANHRFVANAPMVVSFHAMVLFLGAKIGQSVNVWLMKNALPPPDGSTGFWQDGQWAGEYCGDDVPVFQPGGFGSCPVGVNFPITARVHRLMRLGLNDCVYAVPGAAGGCQLANAVNGANTVCYFEGEIIELL